MSPGSRGLAMELRHLCELAAWWPRLAVHRSRVGNLCLWSDLDSSLGKTWLLGADRLSALETVPYGV